MKLVVLVSGKGSNLEALYEAIQQKRCSAAIAAVVADRPAAALDFATQQGIPNTLLRPRDYESRLAWDQALAQQILEYAPDIVVSAGFMRVLGPAALSAYPDKIINIHPSLLPSFPGTDAPAQAVKAGVRISGCTVHIVDQGVDTGTILAQAAVPVLPTDSVQTLHARIQQAEHVLLPTVINRIAIAANIKHADLSYSGLPPQPLLSVGN